MAGDVPRNDPFTCAEADERLKADAGFVAGHAVLQLLHGKPVAGERLEGTVVQVFLYGGHAALVHLIQAFDFMIRIALEVDEAVKGSGIGKNFAVSDNDVIPAAQTPWIPQSSWRFPAACPSGG